MSLICTMIKQRGWMSNRVHSYLGRWVETESMGPFPTLEAGYAHARAIFIRARTNISTHG